MCVHISYWHYVRLHTVVCLISDASSKDYRMCGLYSEITGPELGSFEVRRVNHKLICCQIKRRSRLQTRDIRAMAELCLRVAANNLPVVEQWLVAAHLLLAAKLKDRLGKHLHVESHRVSSSEHEIPAEVFALLARIIDDQVSELVIG